MRAALLLLPTLVVLVACGPLSPERAAEVCEDRARAATGPTGEIGIGIGTGGKVGSRLEVGVTSDYLRGLDPYQVYEDCVRRETGQGPIRPLVL